MDDEDQRSKIASTFASTSLTPSLEINTGIPVRYVFVMIIFSVLRVMVIFSALLVQWIELCCSASYGQQNLSFTRSRNSTPTYTPIILWSKACLYFHPFYNISNLIAIHCNVHYGPRIFENIDLHFVSGSRIRMSWSVVSVKRKF